MIDILLQLALFSAKTVILFVFILALLAGILALFGRGKEKVRGRITLKNLNEKYAEIKETLLEQIHTPKQHKAYLKALHKTEKEKKKTEDDTAKKNIFVLHFHGDMRASAVNALREEISAVLGIATPKDEVVVCLESPGGVVHGYGLAAAQLSRLRDKHIPLTVVIDKVAASGGYLMACVANKILSAPFAIIGSIGVIVQLPNFHRLLKDHKIDFEQLTAGNYKRTLTLFGENTEAGREKLREELEEIHHLFKNLIQEHRPQLNIEKVATGEHWLGKQALELKLVDALDTSDDYLLAQSETANLYEIAYHTKKSWFEKFNNGVQLLKRETLNFVN